MTVPRHLVDGETPVKEYNWTGVRLGNTTSEKVRRALQQFSPYSWTKYTWDIFSSFRRFVSVSFYILCATVCSYRNPPLVPSAGRSFAVLIPRRWLGLHTRLLS